ncbi:muellerian-inhibiting factor isoform X2 [Paramormyrops kingsleyae]|uniref:muellerian-inhibiting factor isoform X2 n=1 Tax=Paramormyrops kingsleyae TaxID=1676925 RepID=UPI000CD62A5B|nr:muellerian-inhibiting factor isoform X2 [Paramormyrops kingsleyae]
MMNQFRVTGEADGGADGGMQKSKGDVGRVWAHPSRSPEGDLAVDSVRTSTSAPEHPPLSTSTDQAAVLKELRVAFLKGLGRKADLGSEDRVRLGLCADPQEQSSAQILPLVLLAKKLSTEQERSRLHILRPAKELWEAEGPEPYRSRLVLHFQLPPSLHSQLCGVSPVLLLHLWGSVEGKGLRVSFTGHSLQPYRQTACLSTGTQFIFLTGRLTESDAQSHPLWRVTMETTQADNGSQLPELPGILLGGGQGLNRTLSPLLLLYADRGGNDMPDKLDAPEIREPLETRPPEPLETRPPEPLETRPPPVSETFLFLCELQAFLGEALSHALLSPAPVRAAPVSLNTLRSLPSMTLGSSSSEPLLLGLLTSSTPTLFSFPPQTSQLRGHRVELPMQPHLLTVLKERLVQAAAQIRSDEVRGPNVTKQLQRLQKLSQLPGEEEEPPEGVGNSRERQYRAVLLLKALQTVLGAWEGARGERAARGGEEEHGRGAKCRLHPLTVPVLAPLLSPPTLTINNCQGSCSMPIFKGTNHAMLLNSFGSKQPLERTPCCVPEEYEDLQVAELDSNGTLIHFKPNMVAKECGCR